MVILGKPQWNEGGYGNIKQRLKMHISASRYNVD